MVKGKMYFDKRDIKKYTWIVSIFWFVIIAASLSWNLITLHNDIIDDAKTEAISNFNKDTAIRMWAASHGGVYVPIDKNTPPNPRLSKIPDRDIVKPNGDTLTLMNPTSMIRQMFDQYPKKYGVVGHITSLKLLNPNNKPDEWERNALHEFGKGKKEAIEIVTFRGEKYFRLFKPLMIKQGCLKCHGYQGYKVGDVRGGVGVSIPMKPLFEQEANQKGILILLHSVIFILGFIGILSSSRKFSKDFTEKEKAKREIEKYRDHLEDLVTERTDELNSELEAHRRDEEFLISEKEFSEKIIQTSNALIIGLDVNHLIKIFNSGAEKITGYTKTEVIGKDWFKIFFPPDMFEEMEKVWANSWGMSQASYENIILTKNGKSRLISWKSTGIYEGKDITKHLLISIGEDISEQKEFEQKLKISRKKYHDLFEKSKDPILIIKEGKFIDCNQATVDILKYKDKEELLQTHPSELSPLKQPDGRNSREKAEEMMELALEKGSHRFEWNHIRANGEVFPVEVLLTAITNDDGSVIIHTTWRDITERKKNEKLQKALFRITEEARNANSIEDLYKSLHKIIESLMPAKNLYLAIHNTTTDIISFPYHADKHDADPEPKPFGKGLTEYVLTTKKSQVITENIDRELQEKKLVELSGEYAKIWIGIYLKFENNFDGVLVIQDYENENAYDDDDVKVLEFVSEQIVKVLDKKYAEERLKQSFKELAEAKQELEIINKNKDRFFSIIAHDLRSPFMAMLGISQMISDDFDNLSVEDIKDMTHSISVSTKNLFKLIENLLSWSRLQMGSFQITPKSLSLQKISSEVRSSLQLSANAKNISIRNEIKETNVFADADCVTAILRNLVNNAIKFTEKNGTIILSAKENKQFVEIQVEDSGVGMAEKTIKNLFSIIEKVSEKGTDNETGTGLGLILCKELVEKNNGAIRVESELGKGSKFIFTLPKTSITI